MSVDTTVGFRVTIWNGDSTFQPAVFLLSIFYHIQKKLCHFLGIFIEAIWAGTAAMVKNDGKQSNEAAFWKKFSDIYGEKALADKPLFDEFYEKEFQKAKKLCKVNPKAEIAVHTVKEMGFRVALATNPIFPASATESRIRWAWLKPNDFELYTTYENIGYCKPNPDYYREISKRLGVAPEQCLMVGNDVTEDMIAETVGMKVFLLSDCLINKENEMQFVLLPLFDHM